MLSAGEKRLMEIVPDSPTVPALPKMPSHSLGVTPRDISALPPCKSHRAASLPALSRLRRGVEARWGTDLGSGVAEGGGGQRLHPGAASLRHLIVSGAASPK